MNIYFCGSIKGGRQLVETYKTIIDSLHKYGQVLTEHVGDASYSSKGLYTDKEVYEQDTNWLKSSDIVIAEITVPSLGVGYELGFAEAAGKPVYCLFKTEKKDDISLMIRGNSYFKCVPYKEAEELPTLMDKIFHGEKI